jgi:hypothetical protein
VAVLANADLWLANNRNQVSTLYFYELYNTIGAFPNTAKYVGLAAPDAVTTSTIWRLPVADGTSGQVVQTNGTSSLGWVNGGSFMFTGNSAGNIGANDFLSLGSGRNAVEAQTQILMPRAGTLKNLFVHLVNPPGAGATQTMTVRVNGVNTTLAVSVTGAATDGNDVAVADYISVAAGDLVSIQCTQGGGPANSNAMIGFEISN